MVTLVCSFTTTSTLSSSIYLYFGSHGASVDMSTEQRLTLYGLYKQATLGRCQTAQPSLLDQVGQAKWRAWDALGDMGTEVAEAAYLKAVLQLGNLPAGPTQRGEARMSGPVFSRPMEE